MPEQNPINKSFYNTILSQTFSPDRNYLIVGDIYGVLSIFHISKLLEQETPYLKSHCRPTQQILFKPDIQINSLTSSENYLIIGTVGEITLYPWKSLIVKNRTRSNSTTSLADCLTIRLPNVTNNLEQNEVNCSFYQVETQRLYAGCGDGNVYVFDLETRCPLKTLKRHTDYIHSLSHSNGQVVSGGEDGMVTLWDCRTNYGVIDSFQPYTKTTIARPDLGKWIGAVSLNDDWLLIGGGPRLSLWHTRYLNNVTIFPIDDNGIHVAEIYNEKILAGGRCPIFYQMNFNGDIMSEIHPSAVTVYSAVYRERDEFFSIAGSSSKIDCCTKFTYKDLELSVTQL